MHRIVVLCALLALSAACEKPRDRACRALLVQADDAEKARTATAPRPRIDAHHAASVARWLRSNAVDDPELKRDAAELAEALDRLARARLAIADASDALGADDATDLVARAEASERWGAHVSAAVADRGRAEADITRLVASLRSQCAR